MEDGTPSDLVKLCELFSKPPDVDDIKKLFDNVDDKKLQVIEEIRNLYIQYGFMNISKLLRDGLWTLSRDESGKILPYNSNKNDDGENFGQYDSEEDGLRGIGR